MLSEFRAFLVLLDRGELPMSARLEFARRVRRGIAGVWARLLGRRWAPLVLPALIILFTAAVSHGFRFGRFLLTRPGSGLHIAHACILVFAMLVGVVIIALGRHALSGRTVRYWLYYCAKSALCGSAVLLLWVESNGLLRSWMRNGRDWRVLLAVPLALSCIVIFGMAILWCLADQRARCPVCLRRLSLPTSMGSWASVFDPPSTELWCEAGHGTLNIAGLSSDGGDRWTALDGSWRDLFRV